MPGTYALVLDQGAERGHACIIEQPTAENGDVLTVLLDDHLRSFGSYVLRAYRT